MAQVVLSPCGAYVAQIRDLQCSIYRVVPEIAVRTVDLLATLFDHKNLPYSPVKTKTTAVEWEVPIENEECSKLAIAVECSIFRGVIIITISKDEPMIIEQEAPVDLIQWIPGFTKSEGAYLNSVQLAIRCDFGLQTKVYSLDCSHVLFTIPKPISQVVIRPGNSRFWTVLLLPYFEKNLIKRSVLADLTASTTPVISHFYNASGSTSTLLASMKLDFTPSLSAQFQWDPTGSWFAIFDPAFALSGYCLRVYNALGLHTEAVSKQLLPGKHFQLTLSTQHDSGVDWSSFWAHVGGQLFVVAYQERVPYSAELQFRIHGVSNLYTVVTATTDFSKSSKKWVYLSDQERYTRTATLSFEALTAKWTHCCAEKDTLVLASERTVVVLGMKCQLELLKFEAEAVISTASPVLQVSFVESKIVLVFKDHLALYEEDLKLLTTGRAIVQAVVQNSFGTPVVTVAENSTSGPKWRRLGPPEETDDASRVDALIKEAQTDEWTKYSDTFQMNKRRRV